MEALNKLEQIKKNFEKALDTCTSAQEVEEIRVKYIGRKGVLTEILKSIAGLSSDEKRQVGKKANILKNEFTEKIKNARKTAKTKKARTKKKIDVTLPGVSRKPGTTHPLTMVMSLWVSVSPRGRK